MCLNECLHTVPRHLQRLQEAGLNRWTWQAQFLSSVKRFLPTFVLWFRTSFLFICPDMYVPFSPAFSRVTSPQLNTPQQLSLWVRSGFYSPRSSLLSQLFAFVTLRLQKLIANCTCKHQSRRPWGQEIRILIRYLLPAFVHLICSPNVG